jgi:hypothetical protein
LALEFDVQAYAVFSKCQRYRYQLWWPTGLSNKRRALGVFANPSTATAEVLDPTVTRWLNYCAAWGFGWAGVVNVRAWRETDPKALPPDPEAIGPKNDHHIYAAAATSELVVCGWGKLGGERAKHVLDIIRSADKVPHALKLNGDGSPSHPLYLPRDLVPSPMPGQTQVGGAS